MKKYVYKYSSQSLYCDIKCPSIPQYKIDCDISLFYYYIFNTVCQRFVGDLKNHEYIITENLF